MNGSRQHRRTAFMEEGVGIVAITVRELAELVQGEVFGDAEQMIHGARPLSDAVLGDITFLDDERHLSQFHRSRASAAIVSPAISPNGKTLVRVKEPILAFVEVVRKLHPRLADVFSGIHPSAQIHPTAKLAPDVSVGPFVSIGEGSVIGRRCRLFAGVNIGNRCRLGVDVALYHNVSLYADTEVGDRVIIHSNAVIGADGFGFRTQNGRHEKVQQLGSVQIGNDVEIGACTTIDRGTFGSTRIGEGTKIDNLVQVGHNCRIGRHNLLVSQVGIAGSVSTGDYVVLAGQVGVNDHVNIGDRCIIGGKAGVTKDIPADQRMLGFPAIPERDQMRIMMSLEKLPEIRRDIKRIKQQLGISDDNDK